MTVLAAVMLAALLLEDDDLRTARQGHDLAGNDGAVDYRRADFNIAVAGNHEHGKFYDVTFFSACALNLDDVFGSNTILFAAGLDDCVHYLNVLIVFLAAPCGAERGLMQPTVRLEFLLVLLNLRQRSFRVVAPIAARDWRFGISKPGGSQAKAGLKAIAGSCIRALPWQGKSVKPSG